MKYKKLYIADPDVVKNMDNFVMCGRNWDYYFSKKPDSFEEVLENVEILKFTNISELNDYIKDKSHEYIDYSMDDEIYVLIEQKRKVCTN